MAQKNLHKLFDYLGFLAFLYLLIDTLLDVSRGYSGWKIVIRLIITLLGTVVDGYLIFIYKEKQESDMHP
jgi:uncharacterized membrane protein